MRILTQVSGVNIPTPTDSSHLHVGFAPWQKGLRFLLIFRPAAFGNVHFNPVNGFMWINHWLVPTGQKSDCLTVCVFWVFFLLVSQTKEVSLGLLKMTFFN